jgi:hypothetical protein
MSIRLKVFLCCLTSVCLLICACATRKPIFLDSDVARREIQTIALLPVVDRRLDRSYEVDLEEAVRDRAWKALENKGYRVVRPASFDGSLDADFVAEMEDDELSVLVPEGADAAAIVYLEDVLSDYKVLYYRFKIETSGTIVSRTGVVWHDKATGASGQGGLISGAFQGWDRSIAYDAGVGGLFQTWPER